MRKLFTYQSFLSKVKGASAICGVNIKSLARGTLLPLTTATFVRTGYSFGVNEKGIIPCACPQAIMLLLSPHPACNE